MFVSTKSSATRSCAYDVAKFCFGSPQIILRLLRRLFSNGAIAAIVSSRRAVPLVQPLLVRATRKIFVLCGSSCFFRLTAVMLMTSILGAAVCLRQSVVIPILLVQQSRSHGSHQRRYYCCRPTAVLLLFYQRSTQASF